ncbi:MAG TPA: prolyl oligopeptidase family serine peptidase [Verrucomicrobiae bacterium]|nr:prolyl oligopeptidase family serine peptidase [Verrucomicrobiae bacterium]
MRLFFLGTMMALLGVAVRGFAADDLQEMNFTVDGVARTALVYVPASAKTNPTAVVFVFHGHGGSSQNAARSFAMDKNWPEAISIYMQGLDTPGQLTDREGSLPGWQAQVGDEGDRDLKFFDAVLARIKQDYHVDAKRIFVTGHSNGGSFTFLLWLARGDVFAAVAPSAAMARFARQLKPKPVMHIAGQSDPLVKFAWQQAMMGIERKIDGCAATGEPWEKQCTLYPSKTGTPVVTFTFPGGHELNPAAPALIVKFFKQISNNTGK